MCIIILIIKMKKSLVKDVSVKRLFKIPGGILYKNLSKTDDEYEKIYDNVQSDRHRYLSPSLSTFQAFEKPFYPKRSYMQYMWDYKNRKYLDCLAQNLTISVGHQHPHVMNTVSDQTEKMVHCTTMYYNDSPIKTAKKLVTKCLPITNSDDPSEDWVVHFVNSGSEAIDLAIMMARAHTGNWDILSLRNSYHGLHSTAMAATGMSVCKQHTPHSFGVKHVMNPDMLRGPFSDHHETQAIVQKYVDEVQNTIDYETSGKVAGFLFEQVQGYGGIHPLPDGYVGEASKIVQDHGGLIIADEVQSGFSRMGDNTFWSFEIDKSNDIYPDIIVTAKGLGNGFPIAAVMTKRKIAESMSSKQFFNTYGGNPTVCSAASAVLDIVTSYEHRLHVDKVGKTLASALYDLKDTHSNLIADVRGRGMMYGIEITEKGAKNLTPSKEIASKVFETARDQGLILGKGGFYGNVLRVMPPMCITEKDVEFLHDVLDYSLNKHS